MILGFVVKRTQLPRFDPFTLLAILVGFQAHQRGTALGPVQDPIIADRLGNRP